MCKVKVILLAVGRTDTGFWADAAKDYGDRLKHYLSFDVEVIPDLKNVRGLSVEQQKEQEGKLILNALQPGDYCVLLDEGGKEFTSTQFASYIEKKMQTVAKRLVFVAGGAFGFNDEVYKRANEKISMSRMTFSHQMIRAVFTEQLYRAMTIIKGEKYHHE